MPRIVHISDWHDQWSWLPEADLYICTGDMLPDLGDWADRDMQRTLQSDVIDLYLEDGGWRKYLGTKDAPVVVVRGNHEFIDLARGFGGDVWEVTEDPTRTHEVCGLKIGGFRGVPEIFGYWPDEMPEADLAEVIDQVPNDVDIWISHCGPSGIRSDRWGSKAYASRLNRLMMEGKPMPRLYCFGHVHGGMGGTELDDGRIFSNAATIKRTIDLT